MGGFSFYCNKCKEFVDVKTPADWYEKGCPICGEGRREYSPSTDILGWHDKTKVVGASGKPATLVSERTDF